MHFVHQVMIKGDINFFSLSITVQSKMKLKWIKNKHNEHSDNLQKAKVHMVDSCQWF